MPVTDHPAEIRLLGPGDDIDAQLDLADRSFGVHGADVRERRRWTTSWLIARGRAVGAFTGGKPAGSAVFHDMRQWWYGREVPMAGVSSVMVAPEHRGRGTGRLLMAGLLEEVAAQGYPLSALYPATMPLYRSLGWELAGARDTAVIPARSLLTLAPPDAAAHPLTRDAPEPALRRAGPDDAVAVLSVLGRVHEAARDCGPVTWDAAEAGQWLAEPDLYAYLCEDGFLAYQWHHRNQDLFVERAEAMSARTVRAFWSHLGSHASIAEKVYARVGPAAAFWWLARERDADVEHRSLWMLRVVDAPAAIAARGFPATDLAVPLQITDDLRAANSGRWELTVRSGAGRLSRYRTGLASPPSADATADGLTPLALGPRGLAALYAGTPVATLRRAGLADGGSPAADAALDAAFAATPFMLDAF